MKHIIAVLNDAYKRPERFKTFDTILEHNVGKLRLAGYKVEYFSDQREGSWYKVSW